jgi:hypothetical protein
MAYPLHIHTYIHTCAYISFICLLNTYCTIKAYLMSQFILLFSLFLYNPLHFGRFFRFLFLYTDCRTPWTGDQPVVRPLPTHRTTQTQNKRTQACMPREGFEPTTPVFERAKTVHALDREVTVNGSQFTLFIKY